MSPTQLNCSRSLLSDWFRGTFGRSDQPPGTIFARSHQCLRTTSVDGTDVLARLFAGSHQRLGNTFCRIAPTTWHHFLVVRARVMSRKR